MTNSNSQNSPPNPSQVLADNADAATSASTCESREQIEARMKLMSRRSFLWSALAIGSGVGGLRWINSRPKEEGIAWPLRRALTANENLHRNLFRPTLLAPTFPFNRIEPIRTNGKYGLESNFDAANWRLQVRGSDEKSQHFTLQQIQQLPAADIITELKCIEGWARVNRWVGVPLRDFLQRFPPLGANGKRFDLTDSATWPAYLGLSTPDGKYYVGLEIEAALHPQTLLCYAMNGAPLKAENGAPLRLAIPVKYGIKSLKRIGTIEFSNQRPPDFWAERGYDYHAGH